MTAAEAFAMLGPIDKLGALNDVRKVSDDLDEEWELVVTLGLMS